MSSKPTPAGHWVTSLHNKPLAGYALAITLMGLALALRLVIAPVEAGLQYVTFFPVVTLVAVIAGRRPAFLSIGLGIILATWIFTPPYWMLDGETLIRSFWSNTVFLLDGLIVAFSIDAMHRYRQQYQAELAESNMLLAQRESDLLALQKFEAIIQSSEDAIISKSLEGIIQSWNPGAEKIFGYTAQEAIGHPMLMLFPPELQHEEADILARIRAGERIEHFETTRQRKDGKLIHISSSMSPVLDGAGVVTGVSKIARDITHTVETQRQLDLFFELSSDLLCIAGSDGYFKRANPAFTLTLGWCTEEMLGRPYLNFVHPDDHLATQQAVEVQLERGERILHFENRYRHRDGSWRTLSWASVPGANGLMYATARDVTEQRAMENALRDNELRTRSILDNVADGIITIDRYGEVKTYNPACEKLFGFTPDEVIGRNVRMLMPEPYHSEHDGYLARYEKTGEQHILGVGRSGGREVVGRRKDGSTFPMSLAVNEMVMSDEKYFIGIVHDITERKRVELELIRAKERAEQANRVKTSFLASMSHEVRTPLGGMLGMLELLSLSELDNEQMETLNTAWASGRGLLRIVNDILDWSKIEEGKLAIVPVPTILGLLLQEVIDTYSRVASAKSLLLWQHVDSRLVHAYMLDQLRLSQVLNNFVSNAIKFTERGEVEIRAELVEETKQGDVIRFAVKDTGIGIPEQDHGRLFQSYEQASGETARMYGGTGLGLAICRRLTEMMEGELGMVSTPDRGSTFSITLTLPRTDAAVVMATPHQVEETQRAIKPLFTGGQDAPQVLVVDDHPTNRELLARQVKILGLRATTAENGRVAVSLWRDGRFALIISDCHMPDMDGYEMARTIRRIEASAQRQRTPIIAWTANALSEEQERIEAAGMDELLVKPVNLMQLRHMLKKWLLPASAQTPESGGNKPAAAPDGPIDHGVLDAILSDPAEQKQLLLDFVQHIRTDRGRLGELLTQQDRAAVQSTAHRMKGSCRMVGARRMGDACAAMEQAAKAGDMDAAAATITELDAATEEMSSWLK